jgi:hypothetical protein
LTCTYVSTDHNNDDDDDSDGESDNNDDNNNDYDENDGDVYLNTIKKGLLKYMYNRADD